MQENKDQENSEDGHFLHSVSKDRKEEVWKKFTKGSPKLYLKYFEFNPINRDIFR